MLSVQHKTSVVMDMGLDWLDDPEYLVPVPLCPAEAEAGTHLRLSCGLAGASDLVTNIED